MKRIYCDCRATEDGVRREAAAMEAVKPLDGCLQVIGKYAGLAHPRVGGVMYHVAMPCAPCASSVALLHETPQAGDGRQLCISSEQQ